MKISKKLKTFGWFGVYAILALNIIENRGQVHASMLNGHPGDDCD